MMRATDLILSAVLSSTLYCCIGCNDRNVAVPRPKSLPRIEIPGSVYSKTDVDGLELFFNSKADVDIIDRVDGRWIDVSYPIFSSPHLFLTLTKADCDNIEDVIANRQERGQLNFGSHEYTITELTTPGGWNCSMSVARGSVAIPVQILAYRDNIVLSGAMTVNLPDSLMSDPTVISPVIDMMERDMLVLLKNLDDGEN